MTYVEFKVKDKEYKLRLNTLAIIQLEKKLGVNPILVFNNKKNSNIPAVEDMLTILEVALKQYHKDVDAFALFDEWLEDGHMVGEFTTVIVELYKSCGLFKKDENEKN